MEWEYTFQKVKEKKTCFGDSGVGNKCSFLWRHFQQEILRENKLKSSYISLNWNFWKTKFYWTNVEFRLTLNWFFCLWNT